MPMGRQMIICLALIGCNWSRDVSGDFFICSEHEQNSTASEYF